MIYKVSKHIEKILGIKLILKNIPEQELTFLPYFLRDIYHYYIAALYGKEVIFISHETKGIITANQYKKHIAIIQKQFNKPIILILDSINPYNRKKLIEQNISFIIPGKQIFIPYLLIDINEYYKPDALLTEKFQPVTQVLLLYHILNESLENIYIRDIAQKLGYTYMSVSRAVSDLIGKNICYLQRLRDSTIIFEQNKRETWEKATPFLFNPVKKIFYSDYLQDDIKFFKANVSALSEYTFLSDNPIPQYAISSREYSRKWGYREINDYEGKNYIEVWKYDPDKISKKDIVDPLSLYLTLKEEEDERIQGELKKLIDKILW